MTPRTDDGSDIFVLYRAHQQAYQSVSFLTSFHSFCVVFFSLFLGFKPFHDVRVCVYSYSYL